MGKGNRPSAGRGRKRSSGFSTLLFVALLIAAVIYAGYTGELPDITGWLGDATSGVTYAGLKVHFIDIGQGDSTLIEGENGECILIDAGPNSGEEALIAYLHEQKVEHFSLVVFTHPHEDHIGGGDRVLKEFGADRVLLPDAQTNTSAFSKLLEAIDSDGAEVSLATPGDILTEGGLSFTVLGPLKSYDSLNNMSVVLRMDYGEVSFMFTGDAETVAERDMLDRFAASEFRAEVLKVGHHGSSTSSCSEFLDAVQPRIAVAMLGKNNDYGHPHRETIKSLSERGITFYRTDELGCVVIVSDGKNVEKYENVA